MPNVADTSAAKILIFTGPLLTVDIGLDQTYRPGAGKHPDLAMKGLQALVDTGAGECCIDSDLAAQLKLPIIDRALIAGAHGLRSANVHLAQIHCPKLEFTMYGRLLHST